MRQGGWWEGPDEDRVEHQEGVPGKVTLTQSIPRRIDRQADGVASPAPGPALVALRGAAGDGVGLPAPQRSRLEAVAGVDLADVRVHTDGASATAAAALGARAFTADRDIHFAAGAYAPDDPFGMHLLAHEVAHTVQQRGQGAAVQAKPVVSEPGEPAEVAADAFADHVVHGGPRPTLAPASAGVIHRAPSGSPPATKPATEAPAGDGSAAPPVDGAQFDAMLRAAAPTILAELEASLVEENAKTDPWKGPWLHAKAISVEALGGPADPDAFRVLWVDLDVHTRTMAIVPVDAHHDLRRALFGLAPSGRTVSAAEIHGDTDAIESLGLGPIEYVAFVRAALGLTRALAARALVRWAARKGGPRGLETALRRLEANAIGRLEANAIGRVEAKAAAKVEPKVAGHAEAHAAGKPAGPTHRGVELVDGKNSPVGEFDEIDAVRFIEDKSAKGLDRLNPRTKMPAQTVEEWAGKQIHDKTATRIDALLNKATATRPTAAGTPNPPSLDEIKALRRLHFRIEAADAELEAAVNAQLVRLRGEFPDWTFTASFGH